MSWKDGDLINTALRLRRLNESIPSSYTVWRSGSTYYAECNIAGGTDYSGTDAATVVNNALSALTAGRTWKEKVVLKGNFVLTTALDVPSRTILEINGELDCSTVDINGINIVGTVGTRKREIEIYGGHIIGIGVTSTKVGILVQRSDFVRLHDVFVESFDIGAEYDYCWVLNSIHDSQISGNMRYNLVIDCDSHTLHAENCDFSNQYNILGAGVLIQGRSSGMRIEKCVIEANYGQGLYMYKTHNNVVTNNWFESNHYYGVLVDTEVVDLPWSGKHEINNNHFTNNHTTGRYGQLYIDRSLYDIVDSNFFWNPEEETYTLGAIILSADANSVVISQNSHVSYGAGVMPFIYNGGVNTIIRDCPNYVTENKGYQTLTAASGSFAHGLASTPTSVNIAASGSNTAGYMGGFKTYLSGSTGIWVEQTGSGTIGYYWRAEV